MQTDTGTNCSVTSNKSMLHQFQWIKSHSIGRVKAKDEAIKDIGKGYIKWTSRSNQVIWILWYYAPETYGTIVSPTELAISHRKEYSGHTYQCDIDRITGSVKFIHRNGLDHAYFEMKMESRLWYAYEKHYDQKLEKFKHQNKRPYEVVHRLSKVAEYELWHQRLEHPG